ncbi:MAG: hypothetical protein CL471_15010 [Acidobacteria bacterium]|nr:hypothetical protein [Acidobacteriota bacterium]
MEIKMKEMLEIYGKYSMGGGLLTKHANLFSNIDDQEIIEEYKTTIKRDLERAGININELKNFKVLDVGTGRQAIAFHFLGAKKVCHYDISPYQVENLKRFIELNSLQSKITTDCADLVNIQLPKNSFNLVYLHGNVHHFSHTGIGLKNCLSAVKKGGYLWLHFYRSGTIKHFVIYLLRDLISLLNVDHREYFINSIILFSDNLFASYIHLYTPKSYIAFVQDCNFEIIFSSKLDPLGTDVDHKYAYESVILVCKKNSEKDLNKCNIDILSPEKSINQLNTEIYSANNHKEILQTIYAYNSLKAILYADSIPKSFIMTIAFKVLRIIRDYDINESENNHKYLQQIFNNSIEIIEKEFKIT